MIGKIPQKLLILAMTLGLACLSWWTLNHFAGPDSFWPTARASAAASLERPPYIGVEIHHGDGQVRSADSPRSVRVTHQTRLISPDTGQIDATITNQSDTSGDVVLYLRRSNLNIAPGERVVQRAWAQVSVTDKRSELSVGFHAMDEQGRYLTQIAPMSAKAVSGLDGEQPLEATYERPLRATSSSGVIAMLLPRIAIFNVAAGASVKLSVRWQQAHTEKAPQVSVGQVSAWPQPNRSARPGETWRLDVMGTGLSDASPQLTSTLSLRKGAEVVFKASRPATPSWRAPVVVRDPWRVTLPQNLPEGDYTAHFELSDPSSTKQRPAVALGQVQISRHNGMLIGQAFHRYPGISERTIGPIEGNHQFVRSLASEFMHLTQWWVGEDRYDWRGLDRWADFHASTGQRRLLVVFSGSPTWASSAPGQESAMGMPGNAAPPLKKLWPAYGRMVKATVSRLKGRLTAVECWNEPDLGEFYTGTSTELADLCAIVHDNSKAVDASVPVICPQPTTPHALSLIYSAKTSSGRPLHELCDMVGSHLYDHPGHDQAGRAYDRRTIADAVEEMRRASKRFGVNKPLAITEYGLSSCQAIPTDDHPTPFFRMRPEAAGEALYQSLASMHAEGIKLVSLYSYDEGITDPTCRPGGSRLRLMEASESGRQKPSRPVIMRIDQAIKDFGLRTR